MISKPSSSDPPEPLTGTIQNAAHMPGAVGTSARISK